jgi:ABC-2 type transport system permease protein
MRLHSVFGKTVWDRRRGLLWWSVGLTLLAVVTLSVWPSVRDEYAKLVQDYPDALLALFGIDKAGVGTASGYLQAELFSFMVPLAFIASMVAGGAAAIAGEEETGTLELLLAQPVSRRRVVVEKFEALCVSLAVITVVFTAVVLTSCRVFDLNIRVSALLAVVGAAYALGLLFGALALFVGGLTGHRALSAGVASAAAAAAYVISSLGSIVDAIKPLRPLSPFWWYSGDNPIRRGLPPAHGALLASVTIAFAATAVVAFDRRDLH